MGWLTSVTTRKIDLPVFFETSRAEFLPVAKVVERLISDSLEFTYKLVVCFAVFTLDVARVEFTVSNRVDWNASVIA